MPEKEVINGWAIGLGLYVVGSAIAFGKWVFGLDGRIKTLETTDVENKAVWSKFEKKYETTIEKQEATRTVMVADIATIKANVENNKDTGNRILDILENRHND